MARFDVYRWNDRGSYLLDIQTDLLDRLNTRVVVPLLPREEAPQPAKRLNPCFTIDDSEVVMVTQFMAAVPRTALNAHVANLAGYHDEIVSAVDFLMQGF